MLRKLERWLAGPALLLGMWVQWAAGQEPAEATQPVPSVLILRNGNTVEGRILQLPEHYQVLMPDAEIRVRASEVEHWCRDLEEGYQRKRAAIRADSVQDHIQLALWCERHGLYGPAASELAAVAAIEPTHPTIGLLQRRITMAVEKPEPLPQRAASIPQGPGPEELDRMARGMPPGAVEGFAQVVQPILMNHCTSGGCHGSQSDTRMQLLRVPTGQPPGRRLTQRNLHSVMEWIDREDPAKSRLLTAANAPHGGGKAPIFTDHQVAQYRRLADWVYRVAQQAPPADTSERFAAEQSPSGPSGFDDVAPAVLPARAGHAQPTPRPAKAAGGAVRAAGATAPAGDGPKSAAARAAGAAKRAAAAKAGRPAPAASTRDDDGGADPFDPDEFNRRFAPAEKPSADTLPTPAAAALKARQ